MCGYQWMCNHRNCIFESSSSDEESIWVHLYRAHNVDFLNKIKLTCCRNLNSGIEQFASLEYYCGISERAKKRHREIANKKLYQYLDTELKEAAKKLEKETGKKITVPLGQGALPPVRYTDLKHTIKNCLKASLKGKYPGGQLTDYALESD